MDIDTLIGSKEVLIAVLSALGGMVVAVVTKKWLNRRSVFSYHVFHNRIGLSADDAIYGSVKVTWDNNPVARLYLSTVELVNESSADFESVKVRIHTSNSKLLTERTELSDTTRNLDFTEEYKQEISVPVGEQATVQQIDLYCKRRDYIIPIMNRGQRARFGFLNEATNEEDPLISLEILHKGIICKFRVVHWQFMGVPRPTAAIAGHAVGFIAIVLILIHIGNPWVVGILSYLIGLAVLIIGAYTVKAYRKIYEWFAG